MTAAAACPACPSAAAEGAGTCPECLASFPREGLSEGYIRSLMYSVPPHLKEACRYGLRAGRYTKTQAVSYVKGFTRQPSSSGA